MSAANVRNPRFLTVLIVGAATLGLAATGQAQTPAAKTPGFTAAQAARGAALYSANCALCHGDGLDDGQFAPPLKGPVHAAYWGSRTAADVLSYINAMMPPSSPGSLGAQGSADVLAYMFKAGGAAPGDKELPIDPAALALAAVY
ncbi:MAG TPA: c-type cytochrome [Caulobacteraceae bacterium]|nr:c-type cytochrome [Caulobacteraceae bacterium]